MYINNVVEHITVCWDMQKNSQCEALLCTFHKWTWPLFHSKHIFFESGCLLDSVPAHQGELIQVLLQALLRQQDWASNRANSTFSRRVFSAVNISNFSFETQQIERSWIASIWLPVKQPSIFHGSIRHKHEQWHPPFLNADRDSVEANILVHAIHPTHVLVIVPSNIGLIKFNDFTPSLSIALLPQPD